MTPLPEGILVLFVLAMPIAAIAWTVTHEDILKEPREYCVERSEMCRALLARKFFYLFTCEYCFSHWVTVGILFMTGFRLIYDDWRGYVISGFSLVWVANHYMSLFGRIRIGIKSERIDVKIKEDLRDSQEAPDRPEIKVTDADG
jgi:hypothetical protein